VRGSAQTDRPHRAEAQRLGAALGHHFDRHAALEVARLLELVRQHFAARVDRGDERLVLELVERAVDVVPDADIATRARLAVAVPARRGERAVPVDRFRRNDRRDRIVEVHAVAAELGADHLAERALGQRAGGTR